MTAEERRAVQEEKEKDDDEDENRRALRVELASLDQRLEDAVKDAAAMQPSEYATHMQRVLEATERRGQVRRLLGEY